MPQPKEKKNYTATEFLAMTEKSQERMELIHGEIYNLAAPSRIHQKIVGRLYSVIDGYIQKNKGKCEVLIAPFDVVLNEKNIVQPDVMVICDPSKLDNKRCYGAPDFVIEITSSNYQTDYTEKLELYKKAGVREYWIVNPERDSVIVLYFEKNPSLFMLYQMADNIPVNIYQNQPVQLEINIRHLLSL